MLTEPKMSEFLLKEKAMVILFIQLTIMMKTVMLIIGTFLLFIKEMEFG